MRLQHHHVVQRLEHFDIPTDTEAEADNAEFEFYLGIGQDRSIGKLAFVASIKSNVSIEQVAKEQPDVIYRENIDPLIGLRSYQVLRIASNLNLPRLLYRPFDAIVQKMYRCFIQSDATSLEVNPLLVLPDNQLMVKNATMSIDDNALFRQPELLALAQPTAAELNMRQLGLTYVQLNGQVGCIVNGAGLAMATMDVINLYGRDSGISPANFLDMGGGADAQKVGTAFQLLRQNPTAQVVFMNIFGGMTRCDEVAQGIISSYEEAPFLWPLVVRLQGTKAAEGQAMLREAGFERVHLVTTLTEGVLMALDKVDTL